MRSMSSATRAASPQSPSAGSSSSHRRLSVGDTPKRIPPMLIRDPFSQADLARRLKTFVSATFVFAPTNVSPLYAAARGWTMVGNDQLTCELCHASLLLSPMLETSDSVDSRIVQKYLALLDSQHTPQCAWRAGPCSESVVDIPLATPSVRAKMLLDHATILTNGIKRLGLEDVECVKQGDDGHVLPPSVMQLFKDVPLGIVHCAMGNWSLAPAASPSATPVNSSAPESVQDAVLACDFCSRRVGVWTCKKDSPHHPIHAHKWYCPYARPSTWSTIIRQLASVSSITSRRPTTTPAPVSASAALQERRNDRTLIRDIRQYEEEEEKARDWKRRRSGIVGVAASGMALRSSDK
ncbi:C3HC zinc finger-like-domain-containing protein [Catenaria anguillulae PL171]|uniref:C3HC zinc finger-like-domain-containing protein n=1 Tax=Catenaria anguillulae PL171 TaxID=765915 RepID=A0A1Y2HAJ5_9FUNG|nr:C3HC zinc finger-like-domain-containing protein [Catenaria anguillulae PL171]